MRSEKIGRWVTAAAVIVAVGCAGGEGDEAADTEADAAEATAAAMPEATAEAVWAYLTESDYQNWPLWPGRPPQYAGSEPHGMLLTTYLNDVALDALNGTATSLPAGAIIVKENYMPDGILAAVTLMYKTEGFSPEHHDWFFLKRLADGTVEVGGRGEGCENCHGAAAANDYILTASLN